MAMSSVKRHPMLIGGELTSSAAKRWITSINPANEEPIGHFPEGTAEDVERAAIAAAAASEAGQPVQPKERGDRRGTSTARKQCGVDNF